MRFPFRRVLICFAWALSKWKTNGTNRKSCSMKIGKFDSEKEVLIVAEIGNNHEGRYELAQKLVQKAAECGVDAVKFQTFDTKFYVSQKDEARYHQLRSFELNISQFKELSDLAHSLGLLFFSTPFDLESVRLLKEIVDA